MADGIIRNAQGQFVKGSAPRAGLGRGVKSGTRLADLIKRKFSDEMEVWMDGKLTKMQRKEIMADTLAQLISTGEVRFPDRVADDGTVLKGKVFKYNSEEWIRQIIRLMRYIEPPVQEVVVHPGEPEGIVFDREFADAIADNVIDGEISTGNYDSEQGEAE